MRFKTAGLNALWDEVGNLSHPDCPFLDRHYSPSTRMPVCDLTPYVTDFLIADDLESLTELLHYFGHTYESLKLASTGGSAFSMDSSVQTVDLVCPQK